MERDRAGLDSAVAAALFALVLLWELAFRPFSRPLVLDPATWDYMSVALLDGRLPYRDIFLHKTPAAAFLGGLGAWLFAKVPSLGLPPVAGAHAVFILLGAAGPALLYLLCRTRSPLLVAIAAAAFMLSFDQWPVAALEGARPKVATTVFGLGCLLASTRGAWRTSGLLGAMATLCWQPGLAFLLGACWELRARERAGRRRGFAGLVVGAAVPVVLLLLWLAWIGALGAFFREAVGFNVYYIQSHARSIGGTLFHMLDQLSGWDRVELLLLPAAVVGLAFRPSWMPPSLGVAGGVYLAMTFVSFQAWPDTILFAAPVAALLAIGVSALATAALRPVSAATLVLVVALAAAVTPHSSRLRPPITYSEQARFMAGLAKGLDETDRVLVVSLPEFLVHTGRHSVWPWPYLWFGVDRYASDHTPGGFEALLADLDRDPPALMLVARRWAGPLRARFDQWASERYRRERVFEYPHTTRPINVYRLRAPGDERAARRTPTRSARRPPRSPLKNPGPS